MKKYSRIAKTVIFYYCITVLKVVAVTNERLHKPVYTIATVITTIFLYYIFYLIDFFFSAVGGGILPFKFIAGPQNVKPKICEFYTIYAGWLGRHVG